MLMHHEIDLRHFVFVKLHKHLYYSGLPEVERNYNERVLWMFVLYFGFQPEFPVSLAPVYTGTMRRSSMPVAARSWFSSTGPGSRSI